MKRPRILNAGVDINHFEPVTFNELIRNNEQYKTQMKSSYPTHILSVRLHLNALKDFTLTKEELIQKISDALKPQNITPYREGLYHCDSSHVHSLRELQNQILHNETAMKLIKNFDVVYIDEQGNYSYVSYLDKDHIYIK